MMWKTGLGKGDMENRLLPMQQVPPLDVTDVTQGYNMAYKSPILLANLSFDLMTVGQLQRRLDS